MQHWSELLATVGEVQRFDYPYMIEGRGRPDVMPKLIAAHRAALQRACRSHGGPAVLIGKSMGSRVGCHLALEEEVAAVVCLGYPLCGAGDRAKLRDQVLLALRTPILFIQGTRDSLCPLDLIESVRSRMTTPNELHVVEGGDHSLLVTKTQLKASGETQEDVDRRVLETIEGFLTRYGCPLQR
jgi:predicted alpha/beta-hydrolase family hydrolase